MKSTERFTDRVENYLKHRPHYGAAVVTLLRRECGLSPGWVIADIGSGTGFSSDPFLRNGNTVYGVEPNGAMRVAAEKYLAGYAGFRSVDGTAEDSCLNSGSVDLVVAGQAFHWFEPIPTRIEWNRILKPGGWVVLMWNDRPTGGSPFFEELEQLLLKYGTDYEDVSARGRATEERLATFYGPGGYREEYLPNDQLVDWPRLEGRVLSSSYAPLQGNPNHEPLLSALRELFDRHSREGRLPFPYRTRVVWGTL